LADVQQLAISSLKEKEEPTMAAIIRNKKSLGILALVPMVLAFSAVAGPRGL